MFTRALNRTALTRNLNARAYHSPFKALAKDVPAPPSSSSTATTTASTTTGAGTTGAAHTERVAHWGGKIHVVSGAEAAAKPSGGRTMMSGRAYSTFDRRVQLGI